MVKLDDRIVNTLRIRSVSRPDVLVHSDTVPLLPAPAAEAVMYAAPASGGGCSALEVVTSCGSLKPCVLSLDRRDRLPAVELFLAWGRKIGFLLK
jgi:hypothetical protein